MTLSQDEKVEVFEIYLRIITDLSQAMNYFNHSKYQQGIDNITIATSSLQELLDKVKS